MIFSIPSKVPACCVKVPIFLSTKFQVYLKRSLFISLKKLIPQVCLFSVEKRKAEVDAEQQKTQEQIQAVVNSYNEKKQQLKVRDFDDAESELTDKLSVQQQGLILEGADNPALMVYANA